jgi:hypothetical protein
MPGEIQDFKLQKRRQEILASLDLHLNTTNAFDSLVSANPTSFLILLNAGCTGGTGSVDSDDVESRFKEFNVERVIMPLSKPYCFLVFRCSNDAAEARDSLDQSVQWDRPILLECIHELPPNLYDRVLSTEEEITGCIPGLHYFSDFVSAAEEEAMLKGIYGSSNDWISLHYRRVVCIVYNSLINA